MITGRCYTVLSMSYLAFLMTSAMLSYRFVNIGPILTASCVFVIPFLYSTADMIAELYGYAAIRRTVWNAFIIAFFMCALLWVLVQLPFSPKYQTINSAYHLVFDPILRAYLANLLGQVVGVFLNAYILLSWKKRVNGRLFFIRSLFSSLLGELIFTTIVLCVVQWGISSLPDIVEMIMVSFAIKVFFGFFSSLFIATIIKPLIEKLELRVQSDSVPVVNNPMALSAAQNKSQ